MNFNPNIQHLIVKIHSIIKSFNTQLLSIDKLNIE